MSALPDHLKGQMTEEEYADLRERSLSPNWQDKLDPNYGKTTLRKLLSIALEDNEEDEDDIVYCTASDEVLDEYHKQCMDGVYSCDVGYYYASPKLFHVWTNDNVYFLEDNEGVTVISSVPRNPPDDQ